MPRILSQFWIIAIMINLTLACAVYHIKYQVIDLERSYLSMKKKYDIIAEANHTLTAEYAYLSRPKRLAALAAKHLDKKYTHPGKEQFVPAVKLANALELKPINSSSMAVAIQNTSPIMLASYQENN